MKGPHNVSGLRRYDTPTNGGCPFTTTTYPGAYEVNEGSLQDMQERTTSEIHVTSEVIPENRRNIR